jgi:hypothetical protein
LIAAILEELGYFDEKKENNKKDEVHAQGRTKEGLKNSGDEEEK